MSDVELQLIVEACRSTFSGRAGLTALPSTDINWNRVVALNRRHRVQGLVWDGTQHLRDEIPGESAARMRAEAEEIIRSNLQIAAESARLLHLFQSEGVDLVFLKGLALAALAYRNPHLKMGWDIDLLVSPGQLVRACQLLRSAGYAPATPDRATNQQLSTWHESRKESVWRTAGGEFYIDLHTRLADNATMLSGVGMASPRQVISIGDNIDLPTLGTKELFAYLAVHGASSAWFRLKWIVDLAGLLSTHDSREIERLYDQSQQLGAGRAAGQALLLIDSLFDFGLGAALRSRLSADPLNRWLARVALREIHFPVEPMDRPLGTLMLHLSQLALKPGPRFAISEARRQFHDVTSRALLRSSHD